MSDPLRKVWDVSVDAPLVLDRARDTLACADSQAEAQETIEHARICMKND